MASEDRLNIERVRNETRKSLLNWLSSHKTSSSNVGLDYVLEAVMSLIKVNHEIWDRCKDHFIPSISTMQEIKMYRLMFQKVAVEPYTSTGYYTDKKGVKVITSPTLSVKSFGCFPPLPKILGGIFPLAYKTFDGANKEMKKDVDVLPDYETYLQNVLLLEDDVLEAFLLVFQKHLEDVQVFLGNIESWYSSEPMIFLNDLFGVDLNVGSIDTDSKSSSSISGDTYCVKCWQKASDRGRYYSCRNGNDCKMYQAQDTKLLTLENVDSMKITFDVTIQRDKDRLKAYLDFLKL